METNNHLSCQQEESNLKLGEEYFWKHFSLRTCCPKLFKFYVAFYGSIIWKIFQEGFQNQYQML